MKFIYYILWYNTRIYCRFAIYTRDIINKLYAFIILIIDNMNGRNNIIHYISEFDCTYSIWRHCVNIKGIVKIRNLPRFTYLNIFVSNSPFAFPVPGPYMLHILIGIQIHRNANRYSSADTISSLELKNIPVHMHLAYIYTCI